MIQRPQLTSVCLLFSAMLVSSAVLTGHSCANDAPNSKNTAEQTTPAKVSDADRLFALEVLPLMKVKCFGCHGADPEDIRGGYDMTNREALIAGGETEEVAIVPGKPDESPLYHAVMWDGSEMPPKENDRLTPEQTDLIQNWIAAGAPWPSDAVQLEIQKEQWAVRENDDGLIVDTSGGTADDWTYRRYQRNEIWAFQPVTKPAVPDGSTTTIDAFVDRRLAEEGLQPSPQADPRTLIRRLSYDLTGLPPTPNEIKDFVASWSQDSKQAWSELTERLLASDQYGERWAQHWLDVVRYADTGGFSNDYERSNAWRFRDYVIRSINSDKPFNEFVIEQIAGDEWKPNEPEAQIATGFLRMGPWGTAMVPTEEARQIFVDDLVHNIGQSFLSMPMRCCKCHDHKFDPLPTRDYYSMYAALATTQPAEQNVAFLDQENQNHFEQNRKLTQELLDYAEAEFGAVEKKQEAAAKEWYEEHDLPYKNENARKNDPEDQKPPRHVGLTPEEKGIMKVRRQDVWIWKRRLERYQPMAQTVYNGPDKWYDAKKLRKPEKINQNWRPENFILAGGSLEAKQDAVTPGVLSALGLPVNVDGENPWSITEDLAGRRLQLAKWIADEKNPLTARSIVNRVWQYHFGTGIVKTANNFGVKGSEPTHPELLDWLTQDFIENGWRLKRLHRQIVATDVYMRSAKPVDPAKQQLKDSANRFLSSFPPRRLTAEEIRDSALLVTGELNLEMGGTPVMPEINMEVALQPRMIQFSIAPAHQPSPTPQERNRRTIYTYRVRGQADPFLEIMNFPNPNESCEMRDSAAVTPQAFTLLNSDVMTDRSIAFASRVQKEVGADHEQWVARSIELAYGRQATQNEKDNLSSYLKKMVAYHEQHQPEPVQYPTEVTRSLVEEFTGEPFEFIEKLNVFENYTPDTKPSTVDASTRALADVCLLLFNSNEFIYLY